MTTVLPGAARESVYKRFTAQWADRTIFTFDGEDFKEPNADWVRVSVVNTGAGDSTFGPIGGRKFGRLASVFVQVFVATNKGRADADGHAQAARDIFEGTRFDGLSFNEGIISEQPQDGQWLPTLMEALFFYEENK